ncbi:unnamed protein product [Clonostachys rosea]|uniref:Uncharacterized protein n=1 Tax=Bionectria ochroleuca TaxID=29856 RepID=A0ABY6UEC8_BIOOC|nr:unnamed protein product [Clonostachys rosea]
MTASLTAIFGKAGALLPWPWLLVGLVVVGLGSVPVYNLFFHPLRKIPGPKSYAATRIPYTKMISSGQMHTKVLDMHKIYGDVVRISPNEVSVIGENVWDELVGHRKLGAPENGKDPHIFALTKHSVLNANRDDHARLRRTLSHGFSALMIEAQEPIISSYVDLLLQRLKENSDNGKNVLELTSWYNWTTFDIIGDLAFGESFKCLQDGDYHPWVSMIFKRIRFNAVAVSAKRWGWLSKVVHAFLDQSGSQAVGAHARLVEEKVRARAAMETTRPDYYHAMTFQEGDKKFSPAELRDNSSTLIIAGSETTATTLSGVTYLVGKHPEVLHKLVQEVRTTFQHENEITIRSVQSLDYMLAVLNEALRMYPPVPGALQRVMNPNGGFISGHWVPGGNVADQWYQTVIGIHHYAFYRNPNYYQLPDSFIPERWQDDPRFNSDAKKVFQPFSFGPRNCIGKNLAYAEMRLILARIIWNFDLHLAADSDGWIDRSEVYSLWHKPDLNAYLVPVVRK